MRCLCLIVIAMFSKAFCFAESQHTFRALIACDTITKRTVLSCYEDLQLMKACLNAICHEIDYKLELTVIKHIKFDKRHVKKWVTTLPDSPNDVVFFFYTGHGFKDPTAGPWPMLAFPWELDATPLRVHSIVKFLRKHQQRLAVVLINACNAPLEEVPAELRPTEPIISPYMKLVGFRSLFAKAKGMVVATAASPGQLGYSRSAGSIFVRGFLEALKKQCHKTTVTWSNVLTETVSKSFGETQDPKFFHGPQTPYYVCEGPLAG